MFLFIPGKVDSCFRLLVKNCVFCFFFNEIDQKIRCETFKASLKINI